MLAQILYTASQIRYYTWRHDVTIDTLYHIFMSVGNTNRLIVAHWWHLLCTFTINIMTMTVGGWRVPDTFLHTAYSVSLKSTARRPSYGDPDHIRQTVPGQSTGSRCHGCCRSVLGHVHQRTVITSRLWSQDSGNTQEMWDCGATGRGAGHKGVYHISRLFSQC